MVRKVFERSDANAECPHQKDKTALNQSLRQTTTQALALQDTPQKSAHWHDWWAHTDCADESPTTRPSLQMVRLLIQDDARLQKQAWLRLSHEKN